MNLLKKLRDLWKPEDEGFDIMQTAQSKAAVFELTYKNQPVGTLAFRDGFWTFVYAPRFAELGLLPLVDFPDTTRPYTSADLWPFFASRIPSLKLPAVQQAAARQQVDTQDTVQMLRAFGKQTITNPFVLEAQ